MSRPAVDRGNNKSSFGTRARSGILDKRSLLFVLYAVYIAFILVSTVPYIAEHQTRYEKVGDDHTYHIVFENDGDDAAHYFDVVRANKTQPGVLDLTYNPSSHTLEVDAKNIVELRLESESIYKDEAEVILGTIYDNDPDYYKSWFIEKDKFTVNVNSDTEITKLVFENVPEPTRVLVDSEEWWKTNTNYKLTGDDVEVTKVPKGATTVEIYFQQIAGKNPIAMFTASKYIATWNEDILFDASGSTDEDGYVLHYIWDFGDTRDGSGKKLSHSYSKNGNYTVILTVRDNDYLEDTCSRTILVVQSGVDTDNDGVADVLDPNPYSALDTDNDGLSDDFELVISKTNLTRKDTDGDGWDDKSELDENTDPNSPTSHPAEPEPEEEDEGIFGMGDMGVVVILLIIIIIIMAIIIMIFVIKRKKGSADTGVEPAMPIYPPEKMESAVKQSPIRVKVPYTDVQQFDESEEKELTELEQHFGGVSKRAPLKEEEPEFECPECGAGVNDEDTVCPKCGLKFQ